MVKARINERGISQYQGMDGIAVIRSEDVRTEMRLGLIHQETKSSPRNTVRTQ
jgi:hypothetical protein